MLLNKGSVLLEFSAVKALEPSQKNRQALAGTGGLFHAAGAAGFTSCR
jgi:hypothetical protein